ncbi:MAG TPA: FAD-dependent oxidoreductase [Burkholderiales bacterium]|jgi:ubiquinone biosynthesis UbiH/UbiF/VisC/COQ6 family hydroxylase
MNHDAKREDLHDVLIVGAGIAGLALALSLSRAGRRVLVLDARTGAEKGAPPEETFDQRIYAIGPGNAAWLDELRIWSAIDPARLTPVYDMRVYGDLPASRVLPLAAGEDGLHLSAYRSAIGELCWIAEEREIARALEAAAGFAAHLTLLRPAEPVLMLQKPDRVQLRLADGRQLEARLLVAADGAQSWVRSAAAIDTQVIDYQQAAVVANFHAGQAHHNCAYQWFRREPDGSGGVLAWLPLPRGQVSMVWSVTDARARELLALDGEALAAEAAAAGGNALGDFRLAGKPASFPLKNLRAEHLIAPRIALVGDAAHVVHPLAGQGLNLGLEDARALAAALAGRRDCGEHLGLRAYERARKAAILEMHAVTHGLTRLFGPAHPGLRAIRNIGLNLAARLPALPQLIARHAAR